MFDGVLTGFEISVGLGGTDGGGEGEGMMTGLTGNGHGFD